MKSITLHALSKAIVVSVAAILLTGCPPRKLHDPELDRFAAALSGTYNSSEQAAADSTIHDLTLRLTPIWEGTKNFRYLYMEQAVTDLPDQPYRQGIFEIVKQIPGRYIVSTMDCPAPERFAGKWREPEFFDTYNPDSFTMRSGCNVYFEVQSNGSYLGQTVGTGCRRNVVDSSYTISQWEIYPQGIIRIDRGYNFEGKQIWGPGEDGGYVFVRQGGR